MTLKQLFAGWAEGDGFIISVGMVKDQELTVDDVKEYASKVWQDPDTLEIFGVVK